MSAAHCVQWPTAMTAGQNDSCRYYGIEFRIVRFMAGDGKYISVAANLPEDGFPLKEIRSLYKMRWGEETGFRELK